MDRNESAPAIVIKSERYMERDRILTLLSPVWGLRRVVVYGAQKSRKAVKASLCTEAVFHVYNNKERHQVSLVDLNIISIHENVLSSLASSFSAALMCEVIMMQKGEDAPSWYELFSSALDSLNEDNYRKVVTQFLIKAVNIAGLSTDFSFCPVCGKPAKRETNTMPQWAGSSWYFLRYVDNHNDKELVSREKADEMLPVDMYIGGVEHAVLHLLYSRFYTKFLCDIGVIDFDEPFHKLFNQGMITGKNGIKMSKSKGNVVSPDDLVRDYGCDSLRMYELFVGPPELDAEWDDRGIDGVNRFLKRLWNLLQDSKEQDVKATKEMIKLRHRMVYDITTRLESFSLNTVISGFMEYNNKFIEIAKKEGGIDKETLETIAVLISPFAPHFAEEMWEQLGHTETLFKAGWPGYDENAMKDDEIEIPVQINGKTKAVISISAEASKDEAIAAGKAAVADKLTGNVIKEIYVPKKIVNIVMK